MESELLKLFGSDIQDEHHYCDHFKTTSPCPEPCIGLSQNLDEAMMNA